MGNVSACGDLLLPVVVETANPAAMTPATNMTEVMSGPFFFFL